MNPWSVLNAYDSGQIVTIPFLYGDADLAAVKYDLKVGRGERIVVDLPDLFIRTWPKTGSDSGGVQIWFKR